MSGQFTIRRATIDDLAALSNLAESFHIKHEYVEHHLTDFQVAIAGGDTILGALALDISELHGRIHSEMFSDFGLSEQMRDAFLERVQSVARSRGLARLWTQEIAPFWKHNGFLPVSNEDLKALPTHWGLYECPWLAVKLRDEELIRHTLEKEFQKLKEEENRTTGNLATPINTMKYVAIGIAVLVAILAIGFCVLLLKMYPQLMQRFRR